MEREERHGKERIARRGRGRDDERKIIRVRKGGRDGVGGENNMRDRRSG